MGKYRSRKQPEVGTCALEEQTFPVHRSQTEWSLHSLWVIHQPFGNQCQKFQLNREVLNIFKLSIFYLMLIIDLCLPTEIEHILVCQIYKSAFRAVHRKCTNTHFMNYSLMQRVLIIYWIKFSKQIISIRKFKSLASK
jgi:hypothetical protein